MSLTLQRAEQTLLKKLKIDCSVQNTDYSVFKLFVQCELIADGQFIYLELSNRNVCATATDYNREAILGSWVMSNKEVAFHILKMQFVKLPVDLIP